MKIVHLTPDFNFAIKFVLPIAKIQSKKNKVYIYAFDNSYKGAVERYENEVMHCYGIEFVNLNIKLRLKIIDYLKSLIVLVLGLRRISPALVVSHTSLDSFIPLILCRLFIKSDLVYFNHGVPFLGYRIPLRVIFSFIERINLHVSHRSLTITNSMRDALSKISPFGKTPALAQPGSACGIVLIDSDFDKIKQLRTTTRSKYNIPNDKFVVLYVGRPVKRKGFFDLIDAWGKFRDDPSSILLIVGSTRTDVAKIGEDLASNIIFFGYQPDPTPFYCLADVLCVPSHHEGLGYCYIEAASAACVPICADIPGPTDFVIDRINGLVCRVSDPCSVAESILLLKEDRKLKERLAKGAFDTSLAFDRVDLAPKVCDALQHPLIVKQL